MMEMSHKCIYYEILIYSLVYILQGFLLTASQPICQVRNPHYRCPENMYLDLGTNCCHGCWDICTHHRRLTEECQDSCPNYREKLVKKSNTNEAVGFDLKYEDQTDNNRLKNVQESQDSIMNKDTNEFDYLYLHVLLEVTLLISLALVIVVAVFIIRRYRNKLKSITESQDVLCSIHNPGDEENQCMNINNNCEDEMKHSTFVQNNNSCEVCVKNKASQNFHIGKSTYSIYKDHLNNQPSTYKNQKHSNNLNAERIGKINGTVGKDKSSVSIHNYASIQTDHSIQPKQKDELYPYSVDGEERTRTSTHSDDQMSRTYLKGIGNTLQNCSIEA